MKRSSLPHALLNIIYEESKQITMLSVSIGNVGKHDGFLIKTLHAHLKPQLFLFIHLYYKVVFQENDIG